MPIPLPRFLGAASRRISFIDDCIVDQNSPLIQVISDHPNARSGCKGSVPHLNPVRTQLIREDQPLRAYPRSSYPVKTGAERAAWLRVGRLIVHKLIHIGKDAPMRDELHDLRSCCMCEFLSRKLIA